MTDIKLKNVTWFVDPSPAQRSEPGIRHSYMVSLATAINYIAGDLDPVWLMGSSSFAFRIVVNENLCPSAMSIFNWENILPEAVRNAGFDCTYISRLWHEGNAEAERREQAHAAIIDGLQSGHPAIVWDIADAEWGLIIGYDSANRDYLALSNQGTPVNLPADRLGRNGVNILSVTIPTGPNQRTRGEMIANSLRAAVEHAEEKEWMDRPRYRDGLPAFDQWALIYDRGALIAEAGKSENLAPDIADHAKYYAEHYYAARRYARDYLKQISETESRLTQVADCYDRVAASLRFVWQSASNMKNLDDADLLRRISQSIHDAGAAEKEGIAAIEVS